MKTKTDLFDKHDLRTGFDGFGRPCVVAKDIATILGYKDAYSVLRIVDAKDKSTAMVCGSTGSRRMGILYPSGILSIATRSNKPKAQELKRWIESEMITSINKIGESDKNSDDSTERSLEVMRSDYEYKMKSYMHELAHMIMDIKDIKRTFEVGKVDIVINDKVHIMPSVEDPFDAIPI